MVNFLIDATWPRVSLNLRESCTQGHGSGLERVVGLLTLSRACPKLITIFSVPINIA
jgi:hypothetical protein